MFRIVSLQDCFFQSVLNCMLDTVRLMGYLLSIYVHTKRASFGTIFTVLWRPYFKDL